MKRTEINDLLMGSYFNALEDQHVNTKELKKIYEKQRVVVEAEEIIKETEQQ